MLQPPDSQLVREALFIYGIYGSGKSSVWACIADIYRRTDTPGHFHVISTEYERAYGIVQAYDGWEQNITIHEVGNFGELEDISAKVHDLGERQDWVIVDSIGNALTWVRNDWFTANRGGLTWREFQATGGTAKDVNADQWITMNNTHDAWFQRYIIRFPGHRLLIAQAEPVETEGKWADKGFVREQYGNIGSKPVGKGDLGRDVHTTLLLTPQREGTPTIRTVKDLRGREYLNSAPMAGYPFGFVTSHLVNVAGWTV